MSNLPNTFDVTLVGKGPIKLQDNWVTEYRPIKFFIKDDGMINGNPSFAILGVKHDGAQGIMEISSEMFRVAYEELKKVYGDNN